MDWDCALSVFLLPYGSTVQLLQICLGAYSVSLRRYYNVHHPVLFPVLPYNKPLDHTLHGGIAPDVIRSGRVAQ